MRGPWKTGRGWGETPNKQGRKTAEIKGKTSNFRTAFSGRNFLDAERKKRAKTVRLPCRIRPKRTKRGQKCAEQKHCGNGYRFLAILNKLRKNISKKVRNYACFLGIFDYNHCHQGKKHGFMLERALFPRRKRFSTLWEYRKGLRHIYSGGSARAFPGGKGSRAEELRRAA